MVPRKSHLRMAPSKFVVCVFVMAKFNDLARWLGSGVNWMGDGGGGGAGG